jgi:hypothetical protein
MISLRSHYILKIGLLSGEVWSLPAVQQADKTKAMIGD